MLSHLVYVSTRKPNCTEAEIEKILESCQRNNRSIDITGVLLYSETQFVQYIEGPYRVLSTLYDKIKTDDRHKDTVLISSAPINQRIFPSWQMGSRKFTSDAIDFKTDISASDKQTFQAILDRKSAESGKVLSLIQKVFK